VRHLDVTNHINDLNSFDKESLEENVMKEGLLGQGEKNEEYEENYEMPFNSVLLTGGLLFHV
jgi:hypothetical protein